MRQLKSYLELMSKEKGITLVSSIIVMVVASVSVYLVLGVVSNVMYVEKDTEIYNEVLREIVVRMEEVKGKEYEDIDSYEDNIIIGEKEVEIEKSVSNISDDRGKRVEIKGIYEIGGDAKEIKKVIERYDSGVE